MKKLFPLFCVVVAAFAAGAQGAPTYSGALSSADGGLVVGGIWAPRRLATPTSLTWTVTQTGACEWHYEYTLEVPAPTIACLIIEASPTFGPSNLLSSESIPAGWAPPGIGLHLVADYPDMPADLYGLAFCSSVDPVELTVKFDSNRCPVWGDFFASGFNACVSAGTRSSSAFVYNAGFLSPDADPTADPDNSALRGHLLVPDSCPCIPAPGAVVLCGLGALLVGQIRRRKTL